MAGPRVTEVSLALYAVIARTGATRPLQEVLSLARIPPRSWRTSLCGFGFQLAYRNVPDECVFNFHGAERDLVLQGVASEKGQNIALIRELFVNSGFGYPSTLQRVFRGVIYESLRKS